MNYFKWLNKLGLIVLSIILLMPIGAFAQLNGEGVPAISNVRGAEYPKVLPDLSVEFKIRAPEADLLQINLEVRDMI